MAEIKAEDTDSDIEPVCAITEIMTVDDSEGVILHSGEDSFFIIKNKKKEKKKFFLIYQRQSWSFDFKG